MHGRHDVRFEVQFYGCEKSFYAADCAPLVSKTQNCAFFQAKEIVRTFIVQLVWEMFENDVDRKF